MTKDEIIAMARKSGFDTYKNETAGVEGYDCTEELERFAALVAAKEREAIAAHYDAQPHVEFFGRELADEIRARGKP